MEDKYIVHFISKTKASMIKFIENKLSKNGLGELIPTHGNILTALYENNGIFRKTKMYKWQTYHVYKAYKKGTAYRRYF